MLLRNDICWTKWAGSHTPVGHHLFFFIVFFYTEAQLTNNRLEKDVQDALAMRKDDEEKNSKIRQLEKQYR